VRATWPAALLSRDGSGMPAAGVATGDGIVESDMTSSVSRKSVSPRTRAMALSLTNPPRAVRGNAGLVTAALACTGGLIEAKMQSKAEAPNARSVGPPVYRRRGKDIPLRGAVIFWFFTAADSLASLGSAAGRLIT
jgi:hypothetical protein